MKTSLSFFALLLSLLVSVCPLSAQEASPAATTGDKKVEGSKNLLQRIADGGWVMVPIGLCSLLTLYYIGDGMSRTGRKRIAPQQHIDALKNLFRAGDYVGAYNYCKANPSPLTNVLRTGLTLVGEGKDVAETAMQEELGRENSEIQTRISYLSVIGVCTPMIGLLGTVVGMMGAFATLGTTGIGDPGALAGHIGEVLVATASGLFVAIPAFVGFYFLRNRSVSALHYIQDAINHLFRKMPWHSLAHAHIGDDELFAAEPNWLAHGSGGVGGGAVHPEHSAGGETAHA